MSNVKTISFPVPAATLLRTVNGQPVNLDWNDIPADVCQQIMIGGAKIILTNAFNGGGKDVKDSEKLAQMLKRVDAWKRGEYVQVERGENAYTAMKEAFIDERRAVTNATRADVEASIKSTVQTVFGKDEKATFARFLDAVATVKAKAEGEERSMTDIRTGLEAKYAKLADEAKAARAKVADALDISGIDF